MDVGAIIALIASGLVLLGGLVTFGYKYFCASKELITNKEWTKIMSIAVEAVEAAEETGKKGGDKKDQVIEAVKSTCENMDIDATEFLDDLSEYIDELIAFKNTMDIAGKKAKKAAKQAKAAE